jgi:hypothetical protein
MVIISLLHTNLIDEWFLTSVWYQLLATCQATKNVTIFICAARINCVLVLYMYHQSKVIQKKLSSIFLPWRSSHWALILRCIAIHSMNPMGEPKDVTSHAREEIKIWIHAKTEVQHTARNHWHIHSSLISGDGLETILSEITQSWMVSDSSH